MKEQILEKLKKECTDKEQEQMGILFIISYIVCTVVIMVFYPNAWTRELWDIGRILFAPIIPLFLLFLFILAPINAKRKFPKFLEKKQASLKTSLSQDVSTEELISALDQYRSSLRINHPDENKFLNDLIELATKKQMYVETQETLKVINEYLDEYYIDKVDWA